jgi:ABC-2 type transport system ATP-binding protein
MWQVVRKLQQSGVTIVLTTHYIEEAEAMADRVAVINKGRILLVEEKTALMARMGRKELRIDLGAPLAELPSSLARFGLSLDADGERLILVYDGAGGPPPLVELVKAIEAEGLAIADMQTRQSSLEEIFVGLVADQDAAREDAA